MQALLSAAALAWLLSAAQAAPPSFYTAAVAQLPVPSNGTTAERHALALTQMDAKAEAARAQGAQIIVFSEGVVGGMWGADNYKGCEVLPEAGGGVPCGEASASPTFAGASCIARRAGLVVVFDMCERQACDAGTSRFCPARG